jgi:hypothetical protein
MDPADARRAEALAEWCALAGFDVDPGSMDQWQVVVDRATGLSFTMAVGAGNEPLRILDQVFLDQEVIAGLDDDLVESVVLARSSMIDARIVPPAAVEIVVAVYPHGLSRHTFMTAVFEVQKVRDLVRREAWRGAADAATVAELERLVGQSADAAP